MTGRAEGRLAIALAMTAACVGHGRAQAPSAPASGAPPPRAEATDPKAALARAQALSDEVLRLHAAGKDAEALRVCEQALALREQAAGPQSPEVADSLGDLAGLALALGAYDRAESAGKRALALREARFGPVSREVANVVNTLGALYDMTGAYDRAEPYYQRALAVRRQLAPKGDPEVATSLNNLAGLFLLRGSYEKAEPLFREAVAIAEAGGPAASTQLAAALSNLALDTLRMGQPDRAEALYRRALALREATQGPRHVALTVPLNNLGMLEEQRGALDRAYALYRRALAIREAALGPDHPDVATLLHNLGVIEGRQRRFARAESLLRRALGAKERALGKGHPDVAKTLSALGDLALLQDDPARAEPLYRQALALHQAALGKGHPDVGTSQAKLATALVLRGDIAGAAALGEQALTVSEGTLRALRASLSEGRLLAFLDGLRAEEDLLGSFLLRQPREPALRRLLLAAALLRKGRSLDEASGTLRAVQQGLGPADRDKLGELRALRSRLANLTLGGPGRQPAEAYRAALADLDGRAERLEEELARRSETLRAARALPGPADIVARVAAALPADAALVEIVAFSPRPLAGLRVPAGTLRYLALVLLPDGRVGAADLGPADRLDAAVARLLHALTRPESDPVPAARALCARVLAPLEPLLEGRTRLLVSPDGQLNLVPLGALHDGRGWIADRYAISYVSSGRDLLRRDDPPAPPAASVLIADPTFASGSRIAPLPGTRAEAQAIARLLPGARLLVGDAATEPALLGLPAPRILHIATHGLFLGDPSQRAGARGLALVGPAAPSAVNPLLRSALVLAGATAPSERAATQPRAPVGDRPDGLATALEMAGMNLWGTELVVLSACDSGRGDVRLGQGVYGLRRALILAGAETVVTSLWRIDDEVTRDLMIRYYRALLSGAGRADALGEAARAVARAHPHPYYWAPFVVVGRWTPLPGALARERP